MENEFEVEIPKLDLKTCSEKDFQKFMQEKLNTYHKDKQFTPETIEELTEIINALTERSHDYGTCVYAMTLAAYAAFNYVSSVLGVTGFQASCADMTFLQLTRNYKNGFKIVDFDNLLYPQFCDNKTIPGFATLIHENRDMLIEAAKAKIAKDDAEKELKAHPNVRAHWEMIASLKPSNDQKESSEEKENGKTI